MELASHHFNDCISCGHWQAVTVCSHHENPPGVQKKNAVELGRRTHLVNNGISQPSKSWRIIVENLSRFFAKSVSDTLSYVAVTRTTQPRYHEARFRRLRLFRLNFTRSGFSRRSFMQTAEGTPTTWPIGHVSKRK